MTKVKLFTPPYGLKCKFAIAQAQRESKDPSHTSVRFHHISSLSNPFLLHCPKFLKNCNPGNVRRCSIRAERRGLWCKRVNPCCRNYALCIVVYLFVGSPMIIDSLALVPLFYATRFSKWKVKRRGTNLMEVISPDYSHVGSSLPGFMNRRPIRDCVLLVFYRPILKPPTSHWTRCNITFLLGKVFLINYLSHLRRLAALYTS